MRRFVPVIFLVCLAAIAMAEPRFQTGVVFSSGFPQGEFAQNVSHAGLGVTWDFYYTLPHGPVSVGTSLGFLTYGSQSRGEILSPTIPDVVVDVDTTNNILLTHFFVRYQPPISNQTVRPYVEGLIGLNYLWTQTSVGDSGDDQFTTTNFSDTALSWGPGAGLGLSLYRGGPSELPPVFRIDLNLGFRYLIGGQAVYLNEGDIQTIGDSVYFTPHRSNTNLFVANLGLGFTF